MNRLFGGGIAALLLLTAPAMAQPVTYYVNSTPYSAVANASACPTGTCVAYSTSQKLTGQFTLAGAPPPNEVGYDVNLGIGAFSLSDGQNTYTDAGLYNTIYINTAKVDTNASGQIIGFEFKIDRVNTPGSFPVNAPGNPAARVSSIWFSSSGPIRASVENNAICMTRGDNAELGPGTPTGGTFGAGCLNTAGTNAQGVSSASAANVTVSLTPPPPPAPVPTMSEWAMILLGALLAGGAALHLQRRRQVA